MFADIYNFTVTPINKTTQSLISSSYLVPYKTDGAQRLATNWQLPDKFMLLSE